MFSSSIIVYGHNHQFVQTIFISTSNIYDIDFIYLDILVCKATLLLLNLPHFFPDYHVCIFRNLSYFVFVEVKGKTKAYLFTRLEGF